jgi:hypothetical protein
MPIQPSPAWFVTVKEGANTWGPFGGSPGPQATKCGPMPVACNGFDGTFTVYADGQIEAEFTNRNGKPTPFVLSFLHKNGANGWQVTIDAGTLAPGQKVKISRKASLSVSYAV